MRIMMLSQFYSPVIGGEERHVVSLSESLAARGHEVTVVSMKHPDRPERLVDRGVTVESVGGSMQRISGVFSDPERKHAPPFPDPELSLKLANLIRAIKPDVVHAHNWLGRSFLPLKRSRGARFVVTLHDYSLVCAKKNMLRKGVPCEGPGMRKCMSCAADHFGAGVGSVTCAGNWATAAFERRAVDRYIAVSHAVAQTCNLVGGSVPYDVLPTFIPDNVASVADVSDDRVRQLPRGGYMLFVGDLNRAKGVHILLAAYARMKNAPPLVLIGRRCVDTPTDLPSNVHLFESWPHASVMRAWKNCLFGLAPSTWAEACGTIVMEANAAGKTMIASRTGGLSDLIDHGKTGLLARPSDVDELASAMRLMIEQPDARERMAAASLVHVERFMAKSIVPGIERVYLEACRRFSGIARNTPVAELAGGSEF